MSDGSAATADKLLTSISRKFRSASTLVTNVSYFSKDMLLLKISGSFQVTRPPRNLEYQQSYWVIVYGRKLKSLKKVPSLVRALLFMPSFVKNGQIILIEKQNTYLVLNTYRSVASLTYQLIRTLPTIFHKLSAMSLSILTA
jgi:hypothetical protein